MSEFKDQTPTSFDAIFSRLQEAIGSTKDSALAVALGITPQSVYGQKKKGQIPDSWYVKIAEGYGVSIKWLKTGEGEKRVNRGAAEELAYMAQGHVARDLAMKMPGIGFPMSSTYNDHEDFDFAEVMAQTIDILKSKTVYTTAIVSNIKAFHKAITTEQQIENMQGQLNQALASFASFQDQLDKTNQVLASLRHENEQLRQELEQSRAGSALSDTG